MNDQRHKPEDLIVRLLRSLGSKKEVDGYLKLFSEVDEKRFAIIKVSGGVVATELEALASSIAFLDNVGLTPVVLHGAGPQLTQALAEANISTTAENGERRTTDRGIEIARKVFQTENLKIVDALESLGVDARPVPTGVFEAELLDRRRLGYVGKVSGVNLQLIESSIRGEQIPVIASLAETPTGQTLNVNADEACRELAKALVPFKVVFLSPDDAMRDEHGAVISTINLAEDYDQLRDAPWLKPSMKKKLDEAKLILDALPRSSSVAIASPENLARELFTHKGAGTIIRRGERVQRFESLDGIDRDRLRALLEDSFGRKLHLDYFDKKPFFRIYLAESYRAVAILTDEAGVPYLDKFAVTSDAQGDGIGASLWQHIARDNRQLFWRARIDNEVNPWYATRATGTFKTDKWMIFWYGIHDFPTIEACVSRALDMPATLKAQGPPGQLVLDTTAVPGPAGSSQ